MRHAPDSEGKLDSGDTPIRFDEYQFTVGDMAFLTGVPQKTIRNWLDRKILNIGTKHFLGRWVFNFLDAFRLRTMRDLGIRLAMPLDAAAHAAECVANLAGDLAALDKRHTGDGFRPSVNLVLAIDDAGKWHGTVANIKEPGKYYSPASNLVEATPSLALLRRAHIVVPVYAMLGDLTEAVVKLAARTRAENGPDDD
jgi:hypothetical protein